MLRATIVLTAPYDPNPRRLAGLTHPLYLALDAAMRTIADLILDATAARP